MKIQQRHGISPLIATIILIAITVIGGALVYSIFLSTAGSTTGGLHAIIESPTISVSSGITLTLKNDGSLAIDFGSGTGGGGGGPILPMVTVDGSTCATPTYGSTTEITPGQSSVITIAADGCTGFTPVAGTSYNINVIFYDITDASSASASVSVAATS